MESVQEPLVSAILAVYNGEPYLAESIASVASQSYRPIEIIVVDDGSTDHTAEIARSFEGVRYIYQTNQGHAAAMNLGVETAGGEFLAFLDADDLWEPNKLDLQVGYLLEHPAIDYVIAKTRNFVEPGAELPTPLTKDLLLTPHVLLSLGTLVARRAAFEVVGTFDVSYAHAKDVDWFIRAREAGLCMAVMPETLLHRRLHGSNRSFHAQARTHEFLRAVRSSIERRRGDQYPEQSRQGDSRPIANHCSPSS
jgi:glycosyltransferase involved in cell wall biosynthesis